MNSIQLAGYQLPDMRLALAHHMNSTAFIMIQPPARHAASQKSSQQQHI
jgi:hypothetical protein